MTSMLLLAACLLITTETSGNDLVGTVKSAEDKPIANATVFIYTAKPRAGSSVLCPSCYSDCRKKATTNESGNFSIPSLDPELFFCVLIVAEGYQPKFAYDVDPQKSPLNMKLEKMPEKLNGRVALRGKILDPQGKLVIGAIVSPTGCKRNDRRWWGSMPGVDAAGITNERGEFLLTGNEGDLGYDLEVKSSNFTKKLVPLLPTGDKVHEISLTEGATVSGRILQDGKPADSVAVGLCQCDRGHQTFIGAYSAVTDKEGRYVIYNVHPNDKYYLYTIMSGTLNRGGITTEIVEVGADGSIKQIDDRTLKPAHRIAGHIILADDKPIPPSTRILLHRVTAWDSQTSELAADGAFHFEGVPEEAVEIYVRIPGCHLTAKRNRLQQIRENTVAVFVDEDKTDLKIYFESEKK